MECYIKRHETHIEVIGEKKSLFQLIKENIFGDTREILNPILLFLNNCNKNIYKIRTEHIGTIHLSYCLNLK